MPYIKSQISRNHFEAMSVQHESFFSVHSLKSLLNQAGFILNQLHLVPLDGGSVVIVASKQGQQSSFVDYYLKMEALNGVSDGSAIKTYLENFNLSKNAFTDMIHKLASNSSIVGYGAGSKGCQLFNVLSLGDSIQYVIDEVQIADKRKYIPGCAHPVISLDEASSNPPDYVLISAPTHIAEISKKIISKFPLSQIIVTSPHFGCVESFSL